MLPKEILKLIEKKFQKEIRYPQDVEALAQAIKDEMGMENSLGVSTLKRIFGIIESPVKPRISTLDILAEYVGYKSFALLQADLGCDVEISQFSAVEDIDMSSLEEGSTVVVRYDPNREIVMTYLGDFNFIVNEANSKLQKGDKLKIMELMVGFKFHVANVIRNGVDLGSYDGAKQGGISSLEIIG